MTVYYHRYLVVPIFLLLSNWATAQLSGEASESTPEELDAAFTSQDAAREAARWSNVVIDRSSPDPLGRAAASADVVLHGTVKSQEVVYDENALPFTHTTLAVTKVLSGAYNESEITLIQEGGPSKTDPESVIMVSDAQHFSVGEEEVLFLELDPDHAVPERRVSIDLRFRVLDGKVYDENGRGLLLTPMENDAGHRVGLSRDRNPAPRFSQIQIGPHTLFKNFAEEEEFPDSGGETQAQARRIVAGYQNSVDVSTLSAAIKDRKGD